MALFTIYDVRIRPGRLDDFYAKEVGGHAMAVRLGAEQPTILRDTTDDHRFIVTFRFADADAYAAFLERVAGDDEAQAYNVRAKQPENPSEVLSVRIVEDFTL
jgi:hypothetical protein